MARRVHDHIYRSPGELIRAVRDEHLLTQDELAERCGLSRYQVCRFEKGTREPTLEAVRRVLGAVGLTITFGVEPSTAALDERLAPGADAMSLDTWLIAYRVVWPALAAGVPMVIGGELAAALQGVPIEAPKTVLHVRFTGLDALRMVVQKARCMLGVLGSSRYSPEPEEITIGSELAVVTMGQTIRVMLVEELPTAQVVTVTRRIFEEGHPIDVPVVPLETLHESGVLGSAAATLAERLLQRAAAHG
ncbi:MAG: helix-turn-helix domain-containing protein [Pseudonocardiales bacterium]